MVLGVRFPKTFEFSQTANPAVSPSDILLLGLRSVNGTPFMGANEFGPVLPIQPGKYSAVRKVVFWCNARIDGTSTTARLRIGIVPTVLGSKDPFELTMTPSTVVRWVGTGSVFPVAATFNAGDLFDKAGPSSENALPNGDNMLDDPASLLRVEFDRFQGDSADFFAVWDSLAAGSDSYFCFTFNLERTDGNDWSDGNQIGQFANIACTVVQAPSTNNRSVTIIAGTQGVITNSNIAASFGDNYRAFFFRYNAAEWDHVTSVRVLGHTRWANNAQRGWNVGFYRLSGFEPTAHDQLYVESFNDNSPSRSGGDRIWFRTADVKDYLQDGSFHYVLFESTITTTTNLFAFLEIVQEGYTNTVCHHPAGIAQREGFNSGGLYGAPATGYFDPTWYQSFADSRILDRKLYLAFVHFAVGVRSEVRLHLDANNESDVTGLANTSTSLAGMNPALNASDEDDVGTKTLFTSTFSPDPINLAGTRRLVWGIVVPTITTEDFPGDGGIYYVLSVPTSEIPEVGPVFPIGALNPEGCASTAAGLGDPGVLVITNGSVPPKKFNPLAQVIEDAGVPAPFCDEPVPTYTVDDTASSPSGGLAPGIYRYRYTFRNCCTGKESNPNDTDIVVDTSGASPAAEVTLNFTGIRIPGDPQICEICVYRTVLDGAFPVMAKVGCFDPDLTTTFVDTTPDDDLDFTDDALSTLNGVPPCTPIVVELKNRLAYMGDIPQLSPSGTVSAVQGSDIITGDFDVEWDRCLEGKYIQLEGDCRPYEILCVMPPEDGTSPALQRLKLVEEYEGASQTGALYTICGHPNRVWFSEPFEPEYVPESNFVDIESGDGDRIMGGVSNFDSLVICKRRKTYVMRWNTDSNPVLGAQVARVSSDIGCIAPRSYAQIESGSVWLSDRGIAIYDGRSVQMVPKSTAFDAFFTDPDNENYVRRDELGRVLGAVGVYYPKREQYLLLLPTVQTERGANLLMVWDTHLDNITVHKFCQEFLSMTVGKDSDGNQRVYVGDTNGFVWILDIGYADGVGVPGQTGTVRGTITASGIDPSLGVSFIEDDDASFITGGLPGLAGLSGVAGLSAAFAGDDLGLAGVCVFFRAAGAALDDPWESRTVFAATPTRLFVTPVLEDNLAGYDYLIGPIDFRAEFKPTNLGDDDTLKRNWRQIVVHEPEEMSSVIRVEIRPDFQNSDDEEGSVTNEVGEVGDGRAFDMNYSRGRQFRPVGRRLYNFEQIVITNFAPNSPVRLLNHLMAVEAHTSK